MRSASRLGHLPVQWVMRAIPATVKRLQHEAPLSLVPGLRSRGAIQPFPTRLNGVHKNNFTFIILPKTALMSPQLYGQTRLIVLAKSASNCITDQYYEKYLRTKYALQLASHVLKFRSSSDMRKSIWIVTYMVCVKTQYFRVITDRTTLRIHLPW